MCLQEFRLLTGTSFSTAAAASTSAPPNHNNDRVKFLLKGDELEKKMGTVSLNGQKILRTPQILETRGALYGLAATTEPTTTTLQLTTLDTSNNHTAIGRQVSYFQKT
ncbi:hypothetical protein COOONC_04230 [Cooperia oncophora]